MHTLFRDGDEIAVGFMTAVGFMKQFTFEKRELKDALSMVNYLNGGKGYPIGMQFTDEAAEGLPAYGEGEGL